MLRGLWQLLGSLSKLWATPTATPTGYGGMVARYQGDWRNGLKCGCVAAAHIASQARRPILRPGSSDRGRPADVNPPEADLVGVEAVEPQVAEDEGLDRTRSYALLTLP